jgi:hypothetical protein
MARHLLDWRTAKDPGQSKNLLENAFKDIAMHQLGLVAGAQACLKKLLERLDPKIMEQEVVGKKGLFKSIEKAVWEVYSTRHKEMFEENSKLFNELIYPNLREGYLKSHAAEADGGPTPSSKIAPPGPGSTMKVSPPPSGTYSKIVPPPAPPPPKTEGK